MHDVQPAEYKANNSREVVSCNCNVRNRYKYARMGEGIPVIHADRRGAMPNNTDARQVQRGMAFKHVAGVGIGAIAVGGLVASIGLLRGKPIGEVGLGAIGGSLVGLIAVAGRGDAIYDDVSGIAAKAMASVARQRNISGRPR